MADRTRTIFGNEMPVNVIRKAQKTKKKFMKKFGDDSDKTYHLLSENNASLYDFIGVKNVLTSESETKEVFDEKALIVGNIRMGFGHYRISMAIASAANYMGYTPYWLDLNSYEETTGGKVINHLNQLYSLGSRLSQRYTLFNRFYWEPLNSEGFKKLSYNASDQAVSTLMTPIFKEIPKDIPYIATHVWPAQAAVHAGMERVINVIPDNWPMALHLSEGSIHTVQTPSSYYGYRTLKNMNKNKINQSMPGQDIKMVGHYIDHELVSNIEEDNAKRLKRLDTQQEKRFMITVGGAGAQKEIFVKIIEKLIPEIKKQKASLFINVGDHINVWEGLKKDIPWLVNNSQTYFDDWKATVNFCEKALNKQISGVHVFYHENIFDAVYSTNLLMRACDVLVTKPSELSFYPVPKLLIKRVGGHEAYGAVRASEIGDGTLECETVGLTMQMLTLMLEDNDIIGQMCHNINKANSIGIYNGAYKAVALALGQELEE